MTNILLNDWYLQSFVDKELPREESNRVWRAIKSNPRFQQKYAALMAQKEMLRKWWRSLTRQERAEVL
jgi:anti-sigma factor RsiW